MRTTSKDRLQNKTGIEIQSPDGVHVTITVEEVQMKKKVSPEELEQRRNLVAEMKVFGKQLEDRHINLGDMIIEGREELEIRSTTRFQEE